MAEGNGSGRLDRIEALMEQGAQRMNELTVRFHEMVDHHDAEFKQLMKWQVLTQDEVRQTSENVKNLGERVDKLVSAIGALIQQNSLKP